MTCKTGGHEFKKIKNDFDNLRIALHCSKCSLKVYFFGVRFKGSEKYVRPIILLIMMVTLLVIIYIMKILIVILKAVIKLL